MTPGGRGVWLQGQQGRLLLALLTLLASFAYLTREPGVGPDLAGMTHQAAQPMPDMAEPPPAAHSHSEGPGPASHDHAAHCPFCFTAAFALESQAPGVPRVSGSWPSAPLPPLPALPGLALVHADARAPPG